MTNTELREMVALTIEHPPCFIEYDRKGGFAWWEQNTFKATPGVAIALNGNEPLGPELISRNERALLLDWEWSYLMHFEMAINNLFRGDIRAYNYTGMFPYLPEIWLPRITDENWHLLYNVLEAGVILSSTKEKIS